MSAAGPVRGILFDLDDTLQDRERAFWAYSEALAKELACQNRLDAARSGELLAFLRANDERGYRPRRALFADMVARFQLDASPESLCRDWQERFGGFAVPEPGAGELIERLRGRARVGLVTNGWGRVQRDKLRAIGLAAAFDAVIISGEVRLEKPDPSIFLLAARRLGLPAKACVMVGDHLEKDVRAAQRAGMRAIWYSRDLPPREGLTPLRSLAAVGEGLEEMIKGE